ncbi:hypothetical protein [Bradyrhizobium sp. USDA 4506]
MSTKKKLPADSRSSGNISAHLGLPNAEEHQLKAALVVQDGGAGDYPDRSR